MWEREIEEMKNAALLAEKKILEVYHSTFKVETKSDDSPVTEADKAADKIIKDYLKERFPDYAFLTEESVDTKERLHKDLLFIIDPVDGTVEFVNKTGGFIGIGRRQGTMADMPTELFTEIDRTKVTTISINQRKAQVISKHPEGSYELVYDENDAKKVAYLTIKDVNAFWRFTDYLVVSTSK